MARVIAIANQKGGVGKSTTAVNVAGYLAASGWRTLLVDMDPQGNASSGLGFTRDPERPSIYDVVIEGRPAAEAISPTSIKGLDVITADISLAGAEIELINMPRRESRLLYALEATLGNYDYILVDCPPSLGLLTLNALVAAKYLMVPIQCEFYALEGLGHLSYTLDLVRRQSNPQLELAGIVMTLYDSRTTLSNQVVEEVRKIYPDVTFKTMIPRNVRLSEAPSYGLAISQYDPRSKGAAAYSALTAELVRRFEPGAQRDDDGRPATTEASAEPGPVAAVAEASAGAPEDDSGPAEEQPVSDPEPDASEDTGEATEGTAAEADEDASEPDADRADPKREAGPKAEDGQGTPTGLPPAYTTMKRGWSSQTPEPKVDPAEEAGGG